MAAVILPFPRRSAIAISDGDPPSFAGDTPVMRFERAYHEASIARAEYFLHDARRMAFAKLDTSGWGNPHNGEEPYTKMQSAILRMAVTPATSEAQLRVKRRLIGRVWLGAEGTFYDALRAGVMIDDLQFGAKPNK